MKFDFWKSRWVENNIGFHLTDVNPLLERHINALNLPPNTRIFIPLCGKTRDIAWLLNQGFQVVGIEIVEQAVTQLFAEMGSTPDKQTTGALTKFSVDKLDVFVGDFFALNSEQLGSVDAIYDRGSLVALPPKIRQHYASHLTELTRFAPQLLINYDYDQESMSGPPFVITERELTEHYGERYSLKQLESVSIEDPLKSRIGQSDRASELIWKLSPL